MAGMSSQKRGRRLVIVLGLLIATTFSALVVANWSHVKARHILRSEFESLGENAQGYKEYRHLETDAVFVLLPRGIVSPQEAKSSLDLLQLFWPVKAPSTAVKVRPFLIPKRNEIDVAPIGGPGVDLSPAGSLASSYAALGLSVPTGAEIAHAFRTDADEPLNAFGLEEIESSMRPVRRLYD